MTEARRLPSMAGRLIGVTAVGSLLMALAVALAAVIAVDEEVAELLDDSLQASAELLAPQLRADALPPSAPAASGNPGAVRFAWAWFDSAGRRVQASHAADPAWPQGLPRTGFADRGAWRLYLLPMGERGVLLVAQTRAERSEARLEVVQFALFAALGLALLGLPLLAWRARRELMPLERLGVRLAGVDVQQADPRQLPALLGEAEREELQPLHAALQRYGDRLGQRLAFEREFSAQAAHLLRTPLAGMDAQLAVALKELPGQPRLQRVREAGQRLQHLVLALLRLFRDQPQLRRAPLDARALLAGLPLGGLQLQDGPPCPLEADAELLAAALLNLVDNAQRHGATRLWLEPVAGGLRLRDDGSGLAPAQRAALRQRLQGEPGAEGGLGLRLAQLVAQAHGGDVALPDADPGFAIDLHLVSA